MINKVNCMLLSNMYMGMSIVSLLLVLERVLS